MSDFSAVPCSEEFGAERSDHDAKRGTMNASTTLRVPYADRFALVQDLLANRRAWPKGGTGSLVPRATSCAIAMVPNVGGALSQQIWSWDALVTVNYTTEIAEVYSESIEPVVEFFTLDYRQFVWGNAAGEPLVEEEAPGVQHRLVNLVRDEFFVQPPLSQLLIDGAGAVNANEFSSALLGLDFAAETLLFHGGVIRHKYSTDGAHQYDITKRWTYNPNGWNKFFRVRDNSYQEIFRITGGPYKNYPVIDMSDIL